MSGTGVAADHGRRTGEALKPEAIVGNMRAGDAEARRTYDLFLDRLARGLAHVVNILDPDMIVLGGGLVEAMPRLITGEVMKSIAAHSTPRAAKALEVVAAKLGRHAVTLGAVCLALDMRGEDPPLDEAPE